MEKKAVLTMCRVSEDLESLKNLIYSATESKEFKKTIRDMVANCHQTMALYCDSSVDDLIHGRAERIMENHSQTDC